MLLLLLASACLLDRPLPDVGACAVYPDGAYDHGEIGIGTCLAGPMSLGFAEGADGPVLLVSNSNHLGTFTGGSLLAIPWSSVDLDQERLLVDQLDAAALDLPSFSAGFDLWQGSLRGELDLALLANRYSPGADTRSALDPVFLLDMTDPAHPAFSDRGPQGASQITLGADPISVVVDDETGRAYVANRTSHSVSILDLTGDEVRVVLPWPEQSLSRQSFVDEDGDGSTAELQAIEVDDSTLVPDESWTLRWSEGTFRVWMFDDLGLSHRVSAGDGQYRASGLGAELSAETLAVLVGSFADPEIVTQDEQAWLYFANDGAVGLVIAEGALTEWSVQEGAALALASGRWDERAEGPSVMYDGAEWRMYYGGRDADESAPPAIGLATSADGLSFSRSGGPVLEPTWPHEQGGITDPSVWFDGESGLFRMVYGAFDGARWTIGQASSVDGLSWTSESSPSFELDGIDVAAPHVEARPGAYRMRYARQEDGAWSVAEAWSPDGHTWQDRGTIAALSFAEAPVRPPGPTAQSSYDRLFDLWRQSSNSLLAQSESGTSVTLTDQGLGYTAVSGFQLGMGAAGSASDGGLALSSVDPGSGLAWYTLRSEGGTPSIGRGAVDGQGGMTVQAGPVLEGEESWESRGVSQPVVLHDDQGWVMLYAAHAASRTTIARATSADGLTWTREGRVVEPHGDWAASEVEPGSLVVAEDGTWHLFYSGSDGDVWSIGEATSADRGQSWTLVESSRGYSLPSGSPGTWDDSGVRDPFVWLDADGTWQMLYAGFDGSTWQIGQASRISGADAWVRFEDPRSATRRPVVTVSDSLFHPDGALRPVVLPADQAAGLGGNGLDHLLWYAGRKDEIDRPGLATGRSPTAFYRHFRLPSPGEGLRFDTQRGDSAVQAIPLDATVGGSSVTAAGLVDLHLDRERGFLYAVSKERPYVFVIDVRDDTPLADGSIDANYLDVEAVISVTNSSGALGFRQVLVEPGGDRLYALNDSPSAVWVLSLEGLEDEAWGRLEVDRVVGFLPAPRGSARDEGESNRLSVAVGQMLLDASGRWLYVSNTNANSIGVYDLWLGPYGSFVREVELLGENPFAMTFTPDGRHIVWANYTGEVDPLTKAASGSLGVLDADPDSPTWLSPLTWIVNR